MSEFYFQNTSHTERTEEWKLIVLSTKYSPVKYLNFYSLAHWRKLKKRNKKELDDWDDWFSSAEKSTNSNTPKWTVIMNHFYHERDPNRLLEFRAICLVFDGSSILQWKSTMKNILVTCKYFLKNITCDTCTFKDSNQWSEVGFEESGRYFCSENIGIFNMRL